MGARRALGVALFAAFALASGASRAAEYIDNEETAPESVEDIESPLRRGFEEEKKEAPLLPRVKEWLQRYPDFFSETSLDLKPRLYYFDRDNGDGTQSEATAIGGAFAYQSGWVKEILQIGAELFTSQPLDAPAHKDGTGLLKPEQEGYTVVGTAYGKLRWRDHVGTLFRQRLDLPYINGNDSRMTPNTFEGGLVSRSVGHWRYYLGHLTRIKLRNDDDFIRISRAAGLVQPTKDGLTVAGGAWTPSERFTLGGLTYFLWDVYNTLYLEGDWVPRFGGDVGLRFGFQTTHQTSVGSERLGRFETSMVGAKASFGYGGAIFTAAFNSVANERAIQSPFGGYPGYLSSMLADFRQAGEDSWGLTASYNFQRIWKLQGLSLFGRVVRGIDGRDPEAGMRVPDRWEYNVTLDYRVKQGWLRGLWIRLRWAYQQRDRIPDRDNVRVIFRWELPVI